MQAQSLNGPGAKEARKIFLAQPSLTIDDAARLLDKKKLGLHRGLISKIRQEVRQQIQAITGPEAVLPIKETSPEYAKKKIAETHTPVQVYRNPEIDRAIVPVIRRAGQEIPLKFKMSETVSAAILAKETPKTPEVQQTQNAGEGKEMKNESIAAVSASTTTTNTPDTSVRMKKGMPQNLTADKKKKFMEDLCLKFPHYGATAINQMMKAQYGEGMNPNKIHESLLVARSLLNQTEVRRGGRVSVAGKENLITKQIEEVEEDKPESFFPNLKRGMTDKAYVAQEVKKSAEVKKSVRPTKAKTPAAPLATNSSEWHAAVYALKQQMIALGLTHISIEQGVFSCETVAA